MKIKFAFCPCDQNPMTHLRNFTARAGPGLPYLDDAYHSTLRVARHRGRYW